MLSDATERLVRDFARRTDEGALAGHRDGRYTPSMHLRRDRCGRHEPDGRDRAEAGGEERHAAEPWVRRARPACIVAAVYNVAVEPAAVADVGVAAVGAVSAFLITMCIE